MSRLAVLYSCDENYAKIMAVSIVSLFENNKDMSDICVYCLTYNIKDETKFGLKAIADKYKRTIAFIDSASICEKWRFWESNEDSRYVRLLADKILKEDSVLYLDCDLIINDSLHELADLDISKYAVAAVLDTCRKKAREESNMQDINNYYNSGVLLMNLKYWRENNLYERFKDFKLKNNNRGMFRDQRILNGTLENESYTLNPKFNVTPELFKFSSKQIIKLCRIDRFYPQEILDKARSKPVIVHFAGVSIYRPWFKNCAHKYKKQYREYMKLDSFTNFELKEEKNLGARVSMFVKYYMPALLFIFAYSVLRKE